ncbi:MAG: DUF192 domain-containing protein [Balneolaceae bacterium]
MRTYYFHLSLLIILVAGIISCNGDTAQNGDSAVTQEPDIDFNQRTLAFLTATGDTVTTISVAVADDQESQAAGLMNVASMPRDAGMLFLFDDEAERSFWMANTLLSLDIMYVNANQEIVRIHQNTPPFSQESILSEVPAQYVVEVNAGFTLRHDITEGMRISF